jgi:hypothetical protein
VTGLVGDIRSTANELAASVRTQGVKDNSGSLSALASDAPISATVFLSLPSNQRQSYSTISPITPSTRKSLVSEPISADEEEYKAGIGVLLLSNG